MSILEEIRESWGWIGIEPLKIVGENDFGNLMIEDVSGQYWRLCPEELTCTVVANDRNGLDRLSQDQDFLGDWHMQRLVNQARENLGELGEGRKYCLAIPGVLGGEYGLSNIKTAPLVELVRLSGDLARQIKDLPDGAQIQLKVAD